MSIALQIALLLMLGVICQWLAWRLRLPAILPLLVAGLVLGPGLGVMDPDAVLGELLFPLVSLGVAVVLFEGSLTLRFSDTRQVGRIIRNLTTIGVLVTAGVMGAAAHWLADLEWSLALLFGALVSVTGPTVVVPMLRSIRPTERVARILRWEGILVDPIGAVLAVLVFEYVVTGQRSESLLTFGKVLTMGAVWGVAGGVVLAQILRRHLLPGYLENYASLALVLLVFTASNALGEESGLIAVTVMGIYIANARDVDFDQLLTFKENLTVLLISMFFILLAARLDVDQLMTLRDPALLILLTGLFLARPLSVLLSSIGTSVNWREMTLIAWVAPRGIVAAAISSLFALELAELGVERAADLVPLTFVMIIGTVTVYSLTSGGLAARLGLSSRGQQGVLISGSNNVALALGEALKANDIRVKIVDTRAEGLKQARMQGLETFYGNPVSEHAERYMDLTGYTHLLAVERNAEANAIVCGQYRHEFGPRRVFSVRAGANGDDGREGFAQPLRSAGLFARDASWSKLASLLGSGSTVKTTSLTDNFDFQAYQAEWGKRALQMFAIDEHGKLRVFTDEPDFQPEPGWRVISLVTEKD